MLTRYGCVLISVFVLAVAARASAAEWTHVSAAGVDDDDAFRINPELARDMAYARHQGHDSRLLALASGKTVLVTCFASQYATEDEVYPLLTTHAVSGGTLVKIDSVEIPYGQGVSSCALSGSAQAPVAIALSYSTDEGPGPLRPLAPHAWHVRVWRIAGDGSLVETRDAQKLQDVVGDPDLYTATAAHHTVAGLSEDGRHAIFGYTVGYREGSWQHRGVFNASVLTVADINRDTLELRRVASADIAAGPAGEDSAYDVQRARMWRAPFENHYTLLATARRWNLTHGGPLSETLLSCTVDTRNRALRIADTANGSPASTPSAAVLAVDFLGRNIVSSPGLTHYALSSDGTLLADPPTNTAANAKRMAAQAAFSPDGRHLAVTRCDAAHEQWTHTSARRQSLLPQNLATDTPCEVTISEWPPSRNVDRNDATIKVAPLAYALAWSRDGSAIVSAGAPQVTTNTTNSTHSVHVVTHIKGGGS